MSEEFFQLSTVRLARALLGTYLSHGTGAGRAVGRIVETEAYLSKNDPASHAARGETKRNAPMFGRAGLSYIYLIYGMHHCFNVVSGVEGKGEAVLIRALEPVEGLELMRARRNTEQLKNLCNGPGKLVSALGIVRDQNRSCLREGPIQILSRDTYPDRALGKRPAIVTTVRVGISVGAELPLRFYLKGSPFVSRI